MRLRHLVATAILCILAACGGGNSGTGPTPPPAPPPPPPPPPAATASAVTAVTPQTQTGTVAQALPVTVRVTTASGAAFPGASVTFAVQAGGGSVSTASATTDAQGQASTTWTLGTTPGANTLRASVGSVTPIDFTATTVAAPATAVSAHAGDDQQGTAGVPVSTAPAVLVRDQFGNPVAGVPVLFAVESGGGTIASPNPTTNAQGVAAAGSWTLGTVAGANSLTATVGALPPVTFTATGSAGPPASVTNLSTVFAATVGTAVGPAPSVRVTDQFGNPVANVAVTFAVTAGGGQVTGGATTTNAQGVATVGGWTLGTVAGTNTLAATVAAIGSTLPIDVTGTPGLAAQLTIAVGNGQSARVGDPVATRPTVQVRDQFQNAVPNATVTFAVSAGGGSVTGATQVSDAQGIARVGSWTLGLFSSTQQLTVTADAAPPVVFSATGTSGWTYSASGSVALVGVSAHEGSNATGTPWANTILGSAPLLGVACSGGFAIVSLFHSNLITKNGVVAYSFDGGAAIGDLWDELAPNFRSLFYPGSSSATKAFATQIALSRNFRIAFSDISGPIFVASFDVRGLSLELPRVMAGCP